MATPAQQSSTNVSDETDLFAFYNELSSHVLSFPKHIGGDMNTQICLIIA